VGASGDQEGDIRVCTIKDQGKCSWRKSTFRGEAMTITITAEKRIRIPVQLIACLVFPMLQAVAESGKARSLWYSNSGKRDQSSGV